MKKKLLSLITMVVAAAFILTGCGGEKKTVLNVYNWGDYIDESVNKDFEEKFNIKVNYETFSTNEDMYIKLKSGGSSYDVVIPSDYMIKRMIDEDLVQKIDYANIPNAGLIEERFKKLEYDPKDEYSVPYMWGTVGILYNKTMVKEPVDSWKILWDEKYSKQILMMDSQRDSLGIALKMLGYSLNTKDEKELEEAKEALIEQKPLVLAYVVDEVKDKMISGEAALAVVWSGDAIYCMRENEDLGYVVPKEGSNLWFDAMVIPKASEHKKEAEAYINFMCETETAFKNTDYIGYSTPHIEARKMLDPELADSKVAYPSVEDVKNCEVFSNLGDMLKIYDEMWTEIKSH